MGLNQTNRTANTISPSVVSGEEKGRAFCSLGVTGHNDACAKDAAALWGVLGGRGQARLRHTPISSGRGPPHLWVCAPPPITPCHRGGRALSCLHHPREPVSRLL